MAKKLPKLPELLERKISKTRQTRDDDDDIIFKTESVDLLNQFILPSPDI